MKTVSVLMSLYQEPLMYIRQSLESLLLDLQEFDAEIILVIDNPNISRNILDYLTITKNKSVIPILIIFNDSNLGLAESLNKGLELVSAKYIMRMDADDVCIQGRVRKQIDVLERNSNVGLVGGSIQKIDKNGKMLGVSYALKNQQSSLLSSSPIFWRTICFHPTWMIRSELLKKYRYVNLNASQDLELLFRLLNDGVCVQNISDIVLKYRINSNSISLKKGWYQYCVRRALNQLYSYERNVPVTLEDIDKVIENYNNRSLRKFLFEKFHDRYIKSLSQKNILLFLSISLISPCHFHRTYTLIKSKMFKG